MKLELNNSLLRLQNLAKSFPNKIICKSNNKQKFCYEVEKVIKKVANEYLKSITKEAIQPLKEQKSLSLQKIQPIKNTSFNDLFIKALATSQKKMTFSKIQLEALHKSSNSTVRDIEKIFKTRQLVSDLFPKNKPGISVVITRNGELIDTFARGLADMEGTPRTPDSKQLFGSTSKQFTAMCILMLCKDSKLKLDDDIRKHLPNLPEFYIDESKVKITIDHLLRMTSGLPDNEGHEYLLGKNPEDDGTTTKQELKMIFDPKKKNKPFILGFKPGDKKHSGDKFFYNNINYDLLAEIVHKSSGKTIREYAEKNIFEPLGMKNTHFMDLEKSIIEQTIPGYDLYKKEEKIVTSKYKIWGSTGVIGTARDMARWQKHIVSDPLGEKLYTHKLKGGKHLYARGMHVIQEKNHLSIFHPGGVRGFYTEFRLFKPKNASKNSIGVFLATNRHYGNLSKSVQELASQIENIWAEKSGNTSIEDSKNKVDRKEINFTPKKNSKVKKIPLQNITKENLKPFTGKYTALGRSYEMKPRYVDNNGNPVKKINKNSTLQLVMYLLPKKNSLEKKKLRYAFVPDLKDKKKLVWTESSDINLQLSKDGFIFTNLPRCIGAIEFSKK